MVRHFSWLLIAVAGGCTGDAVDLTPGPPAPRCGDGRVDPGEACDNGTNDGAYGGCAPDCTLGPRCGDGRIDPTEACDDGAGNADEAGASCRSDCRLPACDDGVVDPGQLCLGRAFLLPGSPSADQLIEVPERNAGGPVDLVLAGDDGATLLRNRGSGRFEPVWSTVTSTAARSNWDARSDRDGDGRRDLLRLSFGPDGGWQGTLWLGTEESYGARRSFNLPDALAYPPIFPFHRDLDGDGLVDLVFPVSFDRRLVVLLNDGTGLFETPQVTSYEVDQISIADLDGDAFADILFRNEDDRLRWAQGRGDGSFGSPQDVIFPQDVVTRRVRAFDIDEDPKAEVIAELDPAAFQVFELSPPNANPVGPRIPVAPGLANVLESLLDVDGDGVEEAVTTTEEGRVLLRLPEGDVLDRLPEAGRATSWDLDEDGADEVVIWSGVEYRHWRLGPSGRLEGPTRFSLDERGRPVKLDDDERPDFILHNHGGFGLALGKHADTAVIDRLELTPPRIALADVDRDGRLDLLRQEADLTVMVQAGDGLGGFGDPASVAPGGPFAVHDFDGDEDPDLVVADGPVLRLLRNDPDGWNEPFDGMPVEGVDHLLALDPGVAYASADILGIAPVDEGFGAPRTAMIPTGVQSLARADVDGDGRLEVLVSHAGGLSVYDQNAALVATSSVCMATVAAGIDLDAEGPSEVAVACDDGVVYVLQGRDLALRAQLQLPHSDLRQLLVADLDDDGDQDLLATARVDNAPSRPGEQLSGFAHPLLNEDGALAAGQAFFLRGAPTSAAVGEVNGDGAVDLVMAGSGALHDHGWGPTEPALVTYLAHP